MLRAHIAYCRIQFLRGEAAAALQPLATQGNPGLLFAAPISYADAMPLEVSALHCNRAGRTVLHGVGFSLADGGAMVLRGPNGVGKSTLLRALAGLLPADGSIRLDGRRLDRDAAAEVVAYAGHLDAVKPQLTVAGNLGFWAALGGGTPGAALQAFELAAIADRPAYLCSAGQKRRLGLARLLLAPRRLWLLDEPTVALDTTAEATLTAAIDRHRAAGGMAIIATHAPLTLAPPAATLTLTPPAAATSGPALSGNPFLTGPWS